MNIVAISDTHLRHNQIHIPECDLLIHAGDATFTGIPTELVRFAEWLEKQPAKNIIFVPGNHEQWLEQNWEVGVKMIKECCPRVIILNDSQVEIDGIKIWGSPVTPWFNSWAWNRSIDEGAVNVHGPFIKNHWNLIPDDIDILVTHGPPSGILDEVFRVDGTPQDPRRLVGCEHLLDAIKRVKPDLHFFGHIHGSHGEKHVDGISFYNVSVCDEIYHPSYKPTIVEYT